MWSWEPPGRRLPSDRMHPDLWIRWQGYPKTQGRAWEAVGTWKSKPRKLRRSSSCLTITSCSWHMQPDARPKAKTMFWLICLRGPSHTCCRPKRDCGKHDDITKSTVIGTRACAVVSAITIPTDSARASSFGGLTVRRYSSRCPSSSTASPNAAALLPACAGSTPLQSVHSVTMETHTHRFKRKRVRGHSNGKEESELPSKSPVTEEHKCKVH